MSSYEFSLEYPCERSKGQRDKTNSKQKEQKPEINELNYKTGVGSGVPKEW